MIDDRRLIREVRVTEAQPCCICGEPVPPPYNLLGARVYCARHFAAVNKPHPGVWRAGLVQIAAVALIIVLAVGLYKAKTDAAQTQRHVRQLEQQVEETEASMRALRAEIAHLESPGRVEEMSENHLGMSVGSESAALPASAMDERLPAPRATKAGE